MVGVGVGFVGVGVGVGVGGVGDDPWTRGLVCTLTAELVDLWMKKKKRGS